MSVAAALNYNYIPNIRRFADRKKAENRLISSHFQPLSGKAHCIKDRVLLDGTCGSGTFIVGTKKRTLRQRNRTLKE